MKKLYFLLPIVLWIITGFVWDYSGQFIIPSEASFLGFWWAITDILFLVVTMLSVPFAVIQNED